MSQKQIILKGKKVILRPLRLDDAKNFCRWLADPDVIRFLDVYDGAPTLREERDWLKQVQRSRSSLRLAIDTIDGRHIGIVSLRDWKNIHRRSEFGIFIGDTEYWGQGCGTEATDLIVDYGFKKLKLHRIYLHLIAYNVRGQRAYRRVGFRLEGRLRGHLYRNKHWHDRLVMGLLRDDYLKSHKHIT